MTISKGLMLVFIIPTMVALHWLQLCTYTVVAPLPLRAFYTSPMLNNV